MSLLHPGLEAFIEVVKRSTVHGAAAELGLTQTGVTQRIRTLEARLGTTLFTRSRKGMRLTEEGEALHRYCQRAKDLEGELWASLGRENDQNDRSVQVTITGPSSLMRCRIIPNAISVLETFPHITFTFHLNDDESGLQALKSGESQLAVLQRHEVSNELDSKLLKPARYILVGTSSWKGRNLEEVIKTERIVDFNSSDDATFSYLKKYELLKHARKERHLANNTDALAMLVAKGKGYSVLSRDFASAFLKRGELIDLNPGGEVEYESALAWYPRHEMPHYFKELIQNIT